MPFALMAVLFVIYLLFFQYDRCLAEQDAGSLLVRGIAIQETGREEIIRELSNRTAGLEAERYVAWSAEKPALTLDKNKISITQRGKLHYPFARLRLWEGDTEWTVESTQRGHLLEPAAFVRKVRRLRQAGEHK